MTQPTMHCRVYAVHPTSSSAPASCALVFVLQLIKQCFAGSVPEPLVVGAYQAWGALIEACHSHNSIVGKRHLLLQPVRFTLLHDKRDVCKAAALDAWLGAVQALADGAAAAADCSEGRPLDTTQGRARASLAEADVKPPVIQVLDLFAFHKLVEPVVRDVLAWERPAPASTDKAARGTACDFFQDGLQQLVHALLLASRCGSEVVAAVCDTIALVVCGSRAAEELRGMAAAASGAGRGKAADGHLQREPTREGAAADWALAAAPGLLGVLSTCYQRLGSGHLGTEREPAAPAADQVGSSPDAPSPLLVQDASAAAATVAAVRALLVRWMPAWNLLMTLVGAAQRLALSCRGHRWAGRARQLHCGLVVRRGCWRVTRMHVRSVAQRDVLFPPQACRQAGAAATAGCLPGVGHSKRLGRGERCHPSSTGRARPPNSGYWGS